MVIGVSKVGALWEHSSRGSIRPAEILHVTTRGARSLTRARGDARHSESMDTPTKISAEYFEGSVISGLFGGAYGTP